VRLVGIERVGVDLVVRVRAVRAVGIVRVVIVRVRRNGFYRVVVVLRHGDTSYAPARSEGQAEHLFAGEGALRGAGSWVALS
jgi:hypothetical protein